MSRRNTDAITIHSILDWIEDNRNLRSPLRKCLSVQVTQNGTCNGCLKRDRPFIGTIYSQPQADGDCPKLKESNEPILYLAERYGFESQQTLTRTFKNYFDVPPHKYRITSMPGESRYLYPLKHCS